ncbi:MAG: translocation/assembly module TamB domain-containing protein [Acidobacteriota bacterium]
MSPKTKHRVRIAAAIVGVLVPVLLVVGIFVARSDWFREFVRQKMITTVEGSTGGKVEIGAFQFDWSHLRAEVDRFVLHGSEGPTEDPLFSARKLTVELRLLSIFQLRKVDISSVAVDEPRVNVIVFPNGSTNIPTPAVKNPSDKSALQTVVDLAIGRFSLTNGSAKFNQQKVPFSAQGQNLQAGLAYETLSKRYTGQLSTNPLYIQYANGSRLNVAVNLPVFIEADKLQWNGATLKTPLSTLTLSGGLENLQAPRISVTAEGQIDVPEFASALGQALSLPPSGTPRVIDVNLDAASDNGSLQIAAMKLAFGQSTVQASGSFRNLALEDGALDVTAHAAIDELGRLVASRDVRTGGVLDLQGKASIKTLSDYVFAASLTGQALSFQSGATRLENIGLRSTLQINPEQVVLQPLHLDAVGGSLDGHAEIANLDRYQFSGTLSGIELQNLLVVAGRRDSGLDAAITGPVSASGSLKNEPLSVVAANLRLAPAGKGVPLSGQVNVVYNAPADTVQIAPSFLVWPSSRLEAEGSLRNASSSNQITARLSTRNLNDFLEVLAVASDSTIGDLPVHLDAGGVATLDATLTGKLSAPSIQGHLHGTRFQVETRSFDELNADISAQNTQLTVGNATLTRGPLRAQVNASVGLENWKPTDRQPLSATIQMQNADVQDVLALAGRTDPVSGALTLNADVSGTVGSPQATASLNITKGSAYGEPLDRADARLSIAGQRVTLNSLQVASNTATLNASATFDHPSDSYTTGTLRGHVEGNQVALSRIAAVQKQRQGVEGDVQVNMDIEATVVPPPATTAIEFVSANGSLGIKGLRYAGDTLGDIQARIQTSGKIVSFNLTSNIAGSSLQADGRTTIAPDYPTEANVNLQNFHIERIVKLARINQPDAKGTLSIRGEVAGTLDKPKGSVNLTLTQGQYNGQPIDRLEAHLDYQETLIGLPTFTLQAGPNQLSGSGSFQHPAGDFARGDFRINAKTNSIQLAELAYVQQERPGLAGTVDVSIDAKGSFDQDRKAQPVQLSALSATANSGNVQLNGRDYGALKLSAEMSGPLVNFKLESNAAQSSLVGTGQVRMAPDYPMTADVTLRNVRYSNWAGLFTANQNELDAQSFDALAEGRLQLSGVLMQPSKLTGTAEFGKFEFYTVDRGTLAGPGNQITLKNDGPVTLAATSRGIEIRRARWLGPSTEVAVTGTIALDPVQNLNLTIKANANLALLHDFDQKTRSEGAVVLDATVKGNLQDPVISGRMELKEAAYQTSGMSNGISHANGIVNLSANSARIETLKAEVGGGSITLEGGATRTGGVVRFDLAARARAVRVLSPVGASVVLNSNLKLTGTSENSLLSGDASVRTVSFNSRTDFGSLLSSAAPPREVPGGDQGFLDRMRLNVGIKMGTDTTFRTTFAHDLQATAELTLRGTAGNPGLLGRISIAQGDLLFFGTKYTVQEGTVSFYNPSKIEPILDLNLATTARNVDVVLVVTGPIQNMNLSYQSDPPLPFSEIVQLLAAGKLPTSDPVLLAHQPVTPAQTLPQMGASALVRSAVTNPIAGRLQRVFGVSQLKIDPTFVSGSELPQANLTLQQQISSNLTFTYVTNLTKADPQIVRVEWALDSNWSAVASRQENGMVAVDLFYKRRFQ